MYQTLTSHFNYMHSAALGLIKKCHELYSLVHNYSGLDKKARALGVTPVIDVVDDGLLIKKDFTENIVHEVAFRKFDDILNF